MSFCNVNTPIDIVNYYDDSIRETFELFIDSRKSLMQNYRESRGI